MNFSFFLKLLLYENGGTVVEDLLKYHIALKFSSYMKSNCNLFIFENDEMSELVSNFDNHVGNCFVTHGITDDIRR